MAAVVQFKFFSSLDSEADLLPDDHDLDKLIEEMK